MTDPLHCTSIEQRVKNCSDIKTRGECEPTDTRYWMNVNGKTHLCEWNPSRNQCVYGPSCECPAAPFELNSTFGPTSCEDLTGDQCHYFHNSDKQRCVLKSMPSVICQNPGDNEPPCAYTDEVDEFRASNDGCPFSGTHDDCQTICKKKNSNFTGPARTILEYDCTFGGYGRYCMCSYPS